MVAYINPGGGTSDLGWPGCIIVPPARRSMESAETFISEARGGALSFPGFNGEILWVLTWVKMSLYFTFFLQLVMTVQT